MARPRRLVEGQQREALSVARHQRERRAQVVGDRVGEERPRAGVPGHREIARPLRP